MSYDRRKVAGGESFEQWYEGLSFKASQALIGLDSKLVGTSDYMGIAYFWNYTYKFELREASPMKRRAVHEAFLKAHLPVDGESPAHAAIVKKICG